MRTIARASFPFAVWLVAIGIPQPASAQRATLSGYASFGMPLKGSVTLRAGAPDSDVPYGDLYPGSLGFGVQYRSLVNVHISVVGEIERRMLGSDPDVLKSAFPGSVEVAGADLTQWRGSAGVAFETNTGKPFARAGSKNFYAKVLASFFRTAPSNVVLTFPDSGETTITPLTSVNDFGLTLGIGAEILVKPNVGITAAFDLDIQFDSDLFDPVHPSTLQTGSLRAGVFFYF